MHPCAQVEMSPPHHGHAEFVVLRARFEAALARAWQIGDKCQVSAPARRGASPCMHVLLSSSAFFSPLLHLDDDCEVELCSTCI
jgi:hypothetical protein